jgi:hypothetical protein
MSEHRIQNEIRNDLAGDDCMTFRANVGKGWTSSKPALVAKKPMPVLLQPGDVVLCQARRFDTGLPEGFADLFGMVKKTITPDMVGMPVALFFAGEVKDIDGKAKKHQNAFLDAVKRMGGLAGVWRSRADARKTLGV